MLGYSGLALEEFVMRSASSKTNPICRHLSQEKSCLCFFDTWIPQFWKNRSEYLLVFLEGGAKLCFRFLLSNGPGRFSGADLYWRFSNWSIKSAHRALLEINFHYLVEDKNVSVFFTRCACSETIVNLFDFHMPNLRPSRLWTVQKSSHGLCRSRKSVVISVFKEKKNNNNNTQLSLSQLTKLFIFFRTFFPHLFTWFLLLFFDNKKKMNVNGSAHLTVLGWRHYLNVKDICPVPYRENREKKM